jgi:hypothetical protein
MLICWLMTKMVVRTLSTQPLKFKITDITKVCDLKPDPRKLSRQVQ